MGEFAASIERSKAKSVSASALDQGLCPWTPLGAPPPDPRYRLALCALAMPPLPNPKYATVHSDVSLVRFIQFLLQTVFFTIRIAVLWP